jgi:adenosylhomocysteine nucleosidase
MGSKDPVPRIAYFAPTQAELKEPLRELRGADWRLRDGPLVVVVGTLHGAEIVLVRTGIGPANAAAAAEPILDTYTVTEAILAGFGGGTRPELDTGDLVVCSELVDLRKEGRFGEERGESPTRISSAESLLERAQATGMVTTTAPALTVSRVVSSPEEKHTLGQAHGAAVVEMEGFYVLRAAHRRGIPGLIVRAILDREEDELPDLTHLASEAGEPRKATVLAHLAAHPEHAAFFYELGKKANLCRRALHGFMKKYLSLLR